MNYASQISTRKFWILYPIESNNSCSQPCQQPECAMIMMIMMTTFAYIISHKLQFVCFSLKLYCTLSANYQTHGHLFFFVCCIGALWELIMLPNYRDENSSSNIYWRDELHLIFPCPSSILYYSTQHFLNTVMKGIA